MHDRGRDLERRHGARGGCDCPKQGEYMVNWYPLGPVNEQLHSESDPWLLWVREQVSKQGTARER